MALQEADNVNHQSVPFYKQHCIYNIPVCVMSVWCYFLVLRSKERRSVNGTLRCLTKFWTACRASPTAPPGVKRNNYCSRIHASLTIPSCRVSRLLCKTLFISLYKAAVTSRVIWVSGRFSTVLLLNSWLWYGFMGQQAKLVLSLCMYLFLLGTFLTNSIILFKLLLFVSD